MVVDCDNALLLSQNETVSGCTSVCRNVSHTEKGCYGINCCQTSLTYPLTSYSTSFAMNDDCTCSQAFLIYLAIFAEKFSPSSNVTLMKQIPVRLDWRVSDLGEVKRGFHDDYSCYNTRVGDDVPTYYCQCEMDSYRESLYLQWMYCCSRMCQL